jgi:hypothetical protein
MLTVAFLEKVKFKTSPQKTLLKTNAPAYFTKSQLMMIETFVALKTVRHFSLSPK